MTSTGPSVPLSFRIPRDDTELIGDRWPGTGSSIVLLHAGVSDRRSWQDVVPRLRKAGTLVTYDRRGYGETPPSAAAFTHLEDLLAVLDDTVIGPAWLVGSSMGGGVALDVALTEPERVAGLVLLAPSVSGIPSTQELDPQTQQIDELLAAAGVTGDLEEVNRLETWLWLDGPAGPPGRVSGPARELALRMNAVALRSGMAEDAGTSTIDAWSRLEELSAPITVAWGDRDVPLLIHECEQLLSRLPHARRALVPQTAHLPYLERPDLIAGLITEAIGAAATDSEGQRP